MLPARKKRVSYYVLINQCTGPRSIAAHPDRQVLVFGSKPVAPILHPRFSRSLVRIMHILHLEDSENDAELVDHVVRREWPDCRLQRVARREEFQAALEQGQFNLILSDYPLPDFDGLSALDLARRQCPDKPFIFLSGTIGEERAVEALQRGASDYVIKDRPGRITGSIPTSEPSGSRRPGQP